MHSTLLRAGVPCALTYMLAGCAFMSRPVGFVPVPHSEVRVTRFGVAYDTPKAPSLNYAYGDARPGYYASPFEIHYAWDRPDNFGAGFDLAFPPNRFADGTFAGMNRQTVESFLRSKPDLSPHEIVSIDVDESARFGSSGFHFVVTKRQTNPGNFGFLDIEEGYLFPHPYDPDYLVVVSFSDYFNPATGRTRDELLRDIAEEWFRSIRLESPGEDEKAYIRRRDWKWVPLDGKIAK